MSLATTEPSDLALDSQQHTWTDRQRSALSHIGVEDASEGDLEVFFHVVKRTGLDPFARQIYMIGRKSRGEVKQTIQTGIDGFRLIGRRAADRSRETIAVDAPEWAHEDGSWRPVWRQAWGLPVAARVTIRRGDQPFTAVALFDEYKQTKFDGNLTQMWGQRPAGQIAKCAEALAWRTAFPQDLSGIYSDDEMGQANSAPREREQAPQQSNAERLRSHLAPTPEPEASPLLNTKSALAKRLYAGITEAGMGKDDTPAFYSEVTGRDITSSKELTEAEASACIDALPVQAELVPEAGEPA